MQHLRFVVIAFCVIACTAKEQEASTVVDSTAQVSEPQQADVLTQQEKAEGWQLLFDGTSLNGWHFYKGQPNNSWEVVDGTLHCKPFDEVNENLRSDIVTDGEYENFELSLEWKISPQGNSGIMYRVSEDLDQPYKSGPEYQVLDDGGYPGETKPTNMTAGCYDMYAVPTKKLNAVGEWNTTKIATNGKKVEHWLNGEKVLTYEIGSNDWQKRKQASKWKDEAGYGMTTKGHIDLQDHSHEVWFRKIMIKPL